MSMLSREVRFSEHPFPLSSLYNSCSHCDKQFALSGHLKKHEGTHSEEQFTCLQCSKKFAIFGDLKQYKSTHAGEESCSTAVHIVMYCLQFEST